MMWLLLVLISLGLVVALLGLPSTGGKRGGKFFVVFKCFVTVFCCNKWIIISW